MAPIAVSPGSSKKHTQKKNPALIALNAIVNDVFAWRNGPNSLSTAIKKHIDHLATQGKTDQQIYQECMIVFDLLYLVQQGQIATMNPSGKKNCASTDKRLLSHLYGNSVKLPNTPNKPSRKFAINITTLKQTLKTNQPQQNQTLHTLALQILGHAPQ